MKRLILSLFIFLCVAVTASAQDRTITGTVTGKDDGQPLPGVSVKIKGAQGGAQTGIDGKYAIKVAAGATAIEFSSIGYVSQSVAIKGTVINVSLLADSKALGEVVVTANAIKREKRTLGYSAPTIKAAELTESGSSSAINSLVGKVAGVNISTSSNTPGSSSRVVLRGGSSITGSNQALIVVDGVPVDNSSITGGANSLNSVDFGNRGNDINPDDIAAVTVLKGPAAAALYGSRASNGALIITTKSGGKNEKTSITFTTNNAFSNVLKLPDFQNQYGQGYPTGFNADGSPIYNGDFRENGSWGAPFTGVVQPWGQLIDGVRQQKAYSAVKNNVRDFFDTGFSTDNNLSFSGGGDKTTFYLGLNGLNSDGVFPGNKDVFNKYGARFNGTAEFSNKFSAGVSFNYSKINSNQVAGGQGKSSVYNNVLQSPRDINIPGLKDLNNKYNTYGYTNAAGVVQPNSYGYYNAYALNPYWVLQNYDNFDDVSRITGNFNVAYKPLKWLDVTERVGIDTYTDRRRSTTPKFNFRPSAEAGNTPYDAGNFQSNNGSYEIDQFNVTELVHDLMITARHKFNEDFEGSFMIGNNVRQRSTNTLQTATNTSGGLVVPGWYNLSNSNGPVNVITDQLTRRRLVGLYADLNLSYKNFLFLEGTARNDWSSTLAPKNNSFFYPSVSASFVFSELLKESSVSNWLSYGKLRSSYAQVGNDTEPYQGSTPYAKTIINGNFGNTTFPLGNVPGLAVSSTQGNPNLKPEKTTSFEVGTELGFFNSRLSVDFSYYKNNSKNQIISIPTAPSTGFAYASINAGEIQNKGIELSVRGTAVKSTNVTWDIYGTFTKNNNLVVDLLPGVEQIVLGGPSGAAIVAAKGRPYGEFYAVADSKDAQGRTIVDPKTGLPIPTSKPQYLGTYNPKFQASLGTNIRYKQLSLGVLFDVKHGGVFYSRTRDITGFVGVSAESGGDRFNQIWPNSVTLDPQGNSVVNNSTTYSKYDYWTGGGRTPGSNIVDASYIKMRSANISYQFTKEQLRRTPFGALTIGLFGNNLFIWTPKSNQFADPEVNSAGATNVQGFDYTAQPSVRNYGVNLKVSF